jgi:hypothetical protein
MAAKKGHVEVCSLLLDLGANIDAIDKVPILTIMSYSRLPVNVIMNTYWAELVRKGAAF